MARDSRPSSFPSSDPDRTVEPEAEALSDAEIFRRAIEQLDEVPNKDLPLKASKPHRVVKRKAAKKVRRPPDDQLDLHGRTVEEARAALLDFIVAASRSGYRVVRVVTGKGFRSEGGTGILKRELERWAQDEGRSYLEAYADAPRALGGRGAYLLYLRRK